jgi:hypothetical protein
MTVAPPETDLSSLVLGDELAEWSTVLLDLKLADDPRRVTCYGIFASYAAAVSYAVEHLPGADRFQPLPIDTSCGDDAGDGGIVIYEALKESKQPTAGVYGVWDSARMAGMWLMDRRRSHRARIHGFAKLEVVSGG